MATGIVVSYGSRKRKKGHFGFIKPDEGGPDVFVGENAVARAGWAKLEPGQHLRFDAEPDPKGRKRRAVNLALHI